MLYKEGANASTSSLANPVVIFRPIKSPTTTLMLGIRDLPIHLTRDLFTNLLIANKDKFLPLGIRIIESNSTTVGSNPAYKFVHITDEDNKGMAIFTIKEDKISLIQYESTTTDYPNIFTYCTKDDRFISNKSCYGWWW
ncbi:MAG TPA: hypothetical protein VJ729_14025 [Nitrososphaeraceae archaeon]|nr:hypothetical protein [Nitrososphaeraceae archaeon]